MVRVLKRYTLRTKFNSLKSADGKFVITDRGKRYLFKMFIKKFPRFSMNRLYEIDDYDVFLWYQFEEMNPTLKNVIETMEESARFFLSSFFTDKEIRFFFSHTGQ